MDRPRQCPATIKKLEKKYCDIIHQDAIPMNITIVVVAGAGHPKC